jgi:hypothetical protein
MEDKMFIAHVVTDRLSDGSEVTDLVLKDSDSLATVVRFACSSELGAERIAKVLHENTTDVCLPGCFERQLAE